MEIVARASVTFFFACFFTSALSANEATVLPISIRCSAISA